jgi:hypothetical protein
MTLMVGLFQVPRCPRCELAPEPERADPDVLWATKSRTSTSGCVFIDPKHAMAWALHLGSPVFALCKVRKLLAAEPIQWEQTGAKHPVLPNVEWAKAQLFETDGLASAAHCGSEVKLVIIEQVKP